MLGTTLATIALTVAAGSTGWLGNGPGSGRGHQSHYWNRTTTNGRFLAPGPGNGWGFSNGNPDGYGWFDYGTAIPMGADRTSEYFFPRYYACPANQMFSPAFYNAYVTRGQRYMPYANCGGEHPMGYLPLGSAALPPHPYQDTIGNGPRVTVPVFHGKIDATPINAGSTGLTP